MVSENPKRLVAMAAGTHPDDIEFMMAGTLLLLREAGAEIHMWNIANGCCGTNVYNREDVIRIRAKEASDAAQIAGATLHPPICDDMVVYYNEELTARAAAVLREVKPDILLLPSPQDYSEDHQNTCRTLTTAAFGRGMPNFVTTPPTEAWDGDIVLYHALPHLLRDELRRLVRPGMYVDVTSTHATKREMLARHRSQKEWLDTSQGFDAYLLTSDEIDTDVGKMSGRYEMAEGWRRHSHLGYGPDGWDPLSEILGDKCQIDMEYEKNLGEILERRLKRQRKGCPCLDH